MQGVHTHSTNTPRATVTTAVAISAPADLQEEAATAALDGNFDALYLQRTRPWLVLILAAYVLLGVLYAINTPAWQAPDEPAHYNYIAHIASTGTLPVLRSGDYNQLLLDTLLKTGFAPMFSAAPLRYESYQPPLYYVAAAPIFHVTNGSLLAIRLFNILLGTIGLVILYTGVAVAFPRKTLLRAGAVAFVALLPMHVANTAAVNNDVLAEVLVLAALLVLLQWMSRHFHSTASTGEDGPARGHDRSTRLLLGLLIGLGMATKIYAYMLLPIAMATVVLVIWLTPWIRQQQIGRLPSWARLSRGIGAALWVAVPAILLNAPLWLRNQRLYGQGDFLGLQWHDQVVDGQPRTVDWIAHFGLLDYTERAFRYTFQSFWGVFGWMGVFMDQRIYTALLVFSGVLFLGLLWAVVRMISGPPDTDMGQFQVSVLVLFGAITLAALGSYIWYNVKFVQHQGRYFFWSLLPISTFVALGWREVMHPLQGFISGLMAFVLAGALAVTGLLGSDLNEWTVLTIGLIALFLMFQPFLLSGEIPATVERLPASLVRLLGDENMRTILHRLRLLAWATPFLLLFLLNLSNSSNLIPGILGW